MQYRKKTFGKIVNYISNLQAFHRQVKESIYNENSDTIMELGAGHLNDLRIWSKKKIKNVIAIEFDEPSIIKGKENYAKLKSSMVLPNIEYVHCDLRKDTAKVIEKYKNKRGMINHIIANFSIHFFLENKETIDGIAKLVRFFLKKGGTFKFTSLDGELIYNKFKRNEISRGNNIKVVDLGPEAIGFKDIVDINETEENTIFFREKNLDYFKIQRLYNVDEAFGPTGQLINVYIISIGMAHNEYLVNVNYLKKKFELIGLRLTTKKSFANYKKNDIVLTQAEKDYSDLEVFVEFTS